LPVSRRSLVQLAAAWGLAVASFQILSLETALREPLLGLSVHLGRVGMVVPGGPAHRAGLRPGDIIEALGGRQLAYPLTLKDLAATSAEPAPEIVYRRGGQLHRGRLSLERPPRGEMIWRLAIFLVGLGTLLTGLVVFLRRQRAVTATFYGMCLALGVLLFPPGWPPWIPVLVLRNLLVDTASAALPPLLVHFFLLFPGRHPVLERRPYLPGLLYLPSAVVLVAAELLHAFQVALGVEVSDLLLALERLVAGLFVLSVGISLVLFVTAYRRMRIPSVRRRVHVTLLGTLLGLVPILAVFLLHLLFPHRAIPGDRAAVVSLVFIPVAFGYAIVRHGVFELDRLVRRSLAVTLLTGAAALVVLSGAFLVRALAPAGALPRLSPQAVAVLVLLLLFSPARSHLQRALDQGLPQGATHPERAARLLGRRLRQWRRRQDLVPHLVEGVARHVGASSAAYFEPGEQTGELRMVYATGIPLSALQPTGLSARLLAAVQRLGEPLLREDLDAELPFGWIREEDRRVLERLDARLLVGLQAAERPLGLLLLGPPAYGTSYEGWHLELLEAFSEHAAVALEMAVTREEMERESQLHYDLQVARSLQRQLLPQHPPRLPGVEVAGQILPCQDVGGDYYDILQPRDGLLVLAVGDVSGKGVPGALLMANLQAIFRAECHAMEEHPERVLERLNERICDLGRPDRFISLFCASLDVRRRRLRYASAGHPPPFLLRASGQVERLDLGGIPLGIQRGQPYFGGNVSLGPGDILVGYSDGVVERQGPTGPLGEEGILRVLRRHRHLSARDLMYRILNEVRFCSTRPLEDDTTVVVLKIL
jgi:serine phosphatase RsbU (regulator of sigma subunit)